MKIPTFEEIEERGRELNKLRAAGKPALIPNDPWKKDRPPCYEPPRLELGDHIEQALKKVGITEERVSAWLRKPCNCGKRKEKLNRLSRWAKSVLKKHP